MAAKKIGTEIMQIELPSESLYRQCSPAIFDCETGAL